MTAPISSTPDRDDRPPCNYGGVPLCRRPADLTFLGRHYCIPHYTHLTDLAKVDVAEDPRWRA